VRREARANQLLHVGSLRQPVLGGDILLQAVARVRDGRHQVGLTLVARPGDEPAGPLPAWVDVRRASGADIDRILPSVLASIVPRQRTPYNDLAVPIKLMEYLSYGRPVITTSCTEVARVVRETGAGLVVDDTAQALAAGIAEVATAPPDVLDGYAAAGHRAALDHSWDHRARQVLDSLIGES
jgi:hypothetical protein